MLPPAVSQSPSVGAICALGNVWANFMARYCSVLLTNATYAACVLSAAVASKNCWNSCTNKSPLMKMISGLGACCCMAASADCSSAKFVS